MAIGTFKEVERGRPVSINSAFVVAYYPDPNLAEVITIELVNGSKFTVMTQEKLIANWLQKSGIAR